MGVGSKMEETRKTRMEQLIEQFDKVETEMRRFDGYTSVQKRYLEDTKLLLLANEIDQVGRDVQEVKKMLKELIEMKK